MRGCNGWTCIILKGLNRLCFKHCNCYNTLFATNERKKHLHTSNSTCSTPEVSTSTHGVAHATGKDDCPQPLPVPVCWWAMRCTAGLWTERESLGLCKVDFSHSWDCACSTAACTLMNDTCMGPFTSIKTSQLTVYHAISIKLSYFPKQGGHNHTTTWKQSPASAESPAVAMNCFRECLMAQAKSMSATTPMT